MKCEKCKACVLTDYECGVWDCSIGVPEDNQVEFPDGDYGCSLHWKTIQKMLREKDESHAVSIADGQKMCNPEQYKKILEKADGERYIHQAMHCIGLDRVKPYKRNGKLYFRPYRNYYNTNYDDKVWSDLRYLGFAECDCNYWESDEKKKSVFYHLNEDGRQWLAGKLGIYKIWKERE